MTITLIDRKSFGLTNFSEQLDGLSGEKLSLFLYRCYQICEKWGVRCGGIEHRFVINCKRYLVGITLDVCLLDMKIEIYDFQISDMTVMTSFKTDGYFTIHIPTMTPGNLEMFQENVDRLVEEGKRKSLVDAKENLLHDERLEMLRIANKPEDMVVDLITSLLEVFGKLTKMN